MIVRKVKEAIVKEVNLKPIYKYYELLDDSKKRTLVEEIIKYLNKYNRALIEIMSEILQSFYDILDLRKETTKI